METQRRFYYEVKPYLPWRLRMFMRRLHARGKRRSSSATWPILPSAGERPKSWPGWPGGKQFALVLTHDVEGPKGLAACRKLMQLEQKAGFVSSFHFIPEGGYNVGPRFRQELALNGFEVAVHDLHHDGKLFRSRAEFAEKAKRINHYLKDWNAVGFRAGFMLHNLEWLQDLEVQYDGSTFDTDPFEPQPDGVGTIFPFWVQRSVPGSGYVELPYTLPQDSTMFVVLQEQSNEIWKQKVDWIAERGGMVLVPVHPDFIAFDGDPAAANQYPARFYSELLAYIKQRYGGAFWHALARDIAAYFRKHAMALSALAAHLTCALGS